jgi:flagellar hook assembly protein FlgD
VNEGPGTPAAFALLQNYPNPFNPSTTIGFSVSQSGPVLLDIYDLTGRHVRTLLSGGVAAGHHDVRWDGRDERGSSVGSGVYFYRLKSGANSVASRKMLLMK